MSPLRNQRFSVERALAWAAIAAFFGGPVVADSRSPASISYPQLDYPVWISASAAEKASLDDRAFFHRQAAERIRHVLSQTPVAGCYQAGPIVLDFMGGRNPPRSFQDAASTYPIFAYGQVRELTPGFLIGEAGHLARLIVTQDSRGVERGQEVFVFLPVGELMFKGKKICKEDPRYVGLPNLGDEMLIFASKPIAAREIFLNIDYPEAVIVISGDRIRLAPPLAAALASRVGSVSNPQTRAELLDLLPTLLATP